MSVVKIIESTVAKLWDMGVSLDKTHKSYESLLPHPQHNPSQLESFPKYIHKVYLQGEESMPEEIRQSTQELIANNPGWTYRFWDEKAVREHILEHFGSEMLAYYDRISPLYPNVKVDFFKFLLIYTEGGVYLDHKSTITGSLDDMLVECYTDKPTLMVAYWDEDRIDGQSVKVQKASPDEPHGFLVLWFVMGHRYHPTLRACILQTLYNIDCYNPVSRIGVGVGGSFRLAGPEMYTDVVRRHAEGVRYIYLLERYGGRFTIYDSTDLHRNAYVKPYQLRTEVIVDNSNALGAFAYNKVLLGLRSLKAKLKGK